MTRPQVSIIIPAYKSEEHIKQCIDSLRAQTYYDWEALIALDAPDLDSTVEILNGYKDGRIKIHMSWEKGNVAQARNRALREAQGEFVALLDADDYWEPDKLEFCVKSIKGKDWIAHCSWLDYNGLRILDETYPGYDTAIGGTGVIFIRRDVLSKVREEWGYVFNEKMDRNDDADLVLRLRKYNSMLYPNPLSYQRMRSGSLTSTTTKWHTRWIVLRMCARNKAWDLLAFHVQEWVLEPLVKIKKKVLK